MTTLAVVFGGVLISFAIMYAVFASETSGRRRLNMRARRLTENGAPAHQPSRSNNLGRTASQDRAGLLERAARRLIPRPSQLRQRLDKTGRAISLGKYMVFCIAAAVGAGVVFLAFTPFPAYFAILIGITMGVGLPHFAISLMIHRNRSKFISVFPDAIDLMVRGLRSGLPVTETIAACGREMTSPVGPEFRRIADLVRLGQTLEQALWDTAGRLDIQEFKFFVISLSVQKETGGNLAETLANLSEILRSRRQMRLKIKAMSSEARASALILGALPFVMLAIIFLMSPDYISLLFTDQRGHFMLGGGFGLMALGGFVMHRMVRFEI